MDWSRRRVLRNAGVGVVGLAGCVADPRRGETPTGSPSDRTTRRSRTPTRTSPPKCDDVSPHPVDLEAYQLVGYRRGFELVASAPTVAPGDDLTIRLRNSGTTASETGPRRAYAIQRLAEDGWTHVLGVADGGDDEGPVTHQPGDGFEWSFAASAEGLSSNGYRACSRLEPGVYRFVYYGLDPSTDTRTSGIAEPVALAVEFGVRRNSAVEMVDSSRVDGYVFDHAGVGLPLIEGGVGFDVEDYASRHHVALLTGARDTDRFHDSLLRGVEPEAERFVSATDFSESVLVVFQTFPASSAPDYRVTRVTRSDDLIHLYVDDSSDGSTADVTVETVLVRVGRGASPPTHATVTTESGRTYSTIR